MDHQAKRNIVACSLNKVGVEIAAQIVSDDAQVGKNVEEQQIETMYLQVFQTALVVNRLNLAGRKFLSLMKNI